MQVDIGKGADLQRVRRRQDHLLGGDIQAPTKLTFDLASWSSRISRSLTMVKDNDPTSLWGLCTWDALYM